MPRRYGGETVLTRWTVDAATWRQFAANVHRYIDAPRAPACVLKSRDQPAPQRLEIIVREDAVFVGDECLSLQFSECEDPHLRDEWLEFSCDNDHTAPHFFPIPVPANARTNAVWVVNHFRQALMDRARRLAEADDAPTFSNRLRKAVEAHFILVLLLFFFVLLPGAAVLFTYLQSLWSGAPR
jgi:hypothetical protein